MSEEFLEFMFQAFMTGVGATIMLVIVEWDPTYSELNKKYKSKCEDDISAGLLPDTLYRHWVNLAYEARFGWLLSFPILTTVLLLGTVDSILIWVGLSPNQNSAGPVIVAILALPSLIFVWFLRAFERDRELTKEESSLWSGELTELLALSTDEDVLQFSSIRRLQDFLSGAKWKKNQQSNSAAIFQIFSSLVDKAEKDHEKVTGVLVEVDEPMAQQDQELDEGEGVLVKQPLEQSPLLRAIGSVIRSSIGSRGPKVVNNNLSDTNFSFLDLSFLNLSDMNLYQSRFKRANLSYCNMARARLGQANLEFANLREADLQEATLPMASINDCDLTNANLSRATLFFAKLNRTSLRFANLGNANFRFSECVGAIFERANLNGVAFHGAKLNEANFLGADLTNANLLSAVLTGAVLTDAILEGAILLDANLEDANLQNANLKGANLDGANLKGVNLDGANLEGAFRPEGFPNA